MHSGATSDRPAAGWLLDASASIYTLGGASCLGGFVRTLQLSCALEIDGPHPFRSEAPAIVAYWHEFAIAGFVFLLAVKRPLAALCHPSLRLSPWAEFGRRRGWRMALGSTGHRGRVASNEVVRGLRDGLSTFVCPDGPAGPPHALHRGALHMASQSGVPIIPVRFTCTATLRMRSWDRMHLPLPGSTIRARVGAPIRVGADLAASERELRLALGA